MVNSSGVTFLNALVNVLHSVLTWGHNPEKRSNGVKFSAWKSLVDVFILTSGLRSLLLQASFSICRSSINTAAYFRKMACLKEEFIFVLFGFIHGNNNHNNYTRSKKIHNSGENKFSQLVFRNFQSLAGSEYICEQTSLHVLHCTVNLWPDLLALVNQTCDLLNATTPHLLLILLGTSCWLDEAFRRQGASVSSWTTRKVGLQFRIVWLV